jgi:hypothetical protein
MRQDEWNRINVRTFDMHVMNDSAIQLDLKLRKLIEVVFCFSPVETIAPMFNECFDNRQRCSIFPGALSKLVWPSGQREAELEIGHGGLGDVDGKWNAFHGFTNGTNLREDSLFYGKYGAAQLRGAYPRIAVMQSCIALKGIANEDG